MTGVDFSLNQKPAYDGAYYNIITYTLKNNASDDELLEAGKNIRNTRFFYNLLAWGNSSAANALAAFLDGKVVSTAPNVVSSSTVGINAAGNAVTTASGEKGISITAKTSGIGGQISGFTISVSDNKGNVRKSANAALDAFTETIRAQNASEENAITLQVGANANQSSSNVLSLLQ